MVSGGKQCCILGKARNGAPSLTALSCQLFPAKQGHFFPTKEAPVTSSMRRHSGRVTGAGSPWFRAGTSRSFHPQVPQLHWKHTQYLSRRQKGFPRKSWISLSCPCGHPTFPLHLQECRAGVPSREPFGTCPNCCTSVSGSAHISKLGEHEAAAGDQSWNCHLRGDKWSQRGRFGCKIGSEWREIWGCLDSKPRPLPTRGSFTLTQRCHFPPPSHTCS